MKKYIAFGLYQTNEKGGHQEAMGPDDPKPGAAKHVYLADEVEVVLAQIRNGCVDDGDEGNALFKLSPGEIRKLIDTWLMGRSSHD